MVKKTECEKLKPKERKKCLKPKRRKYRQKELIWFVGFGFIIGGVINGLISGNYLWTTIGGAICFFGLAVEAM